ncbi:hypothetical protein LLH00_06110 [bacterium]|nr:hypothetical protein [bacterium]
MRRSTALTPTVCPPRSSWPLSYSLMTTDKLNWLVCGEIWRNSNIPTSYSTATGLSFSFTPFMYGALRLGLQVQTDEYTKGADDYGYEYLYDAPTLRGLSSGGGQKLDFAGRVVEFGYAYRNKRRLSADNLFTVQFGF